VFDFTSCLTPTPGGSVGGRSPEDMAEKMLFVFAFFVTCPGDAVISVLFTKNCIKSEIEISFIAHLIFRLIVCP
jgi:hypothetical protein